MCLQQTLKLVRLSQVLMTVGKLFHRDAVATANEQSPALVRVRFTSNMLLFAERSVLVGWSGWRVHADDVKQAHLGDMYVDLTLGEEAVLWLHGVQDRASHGVGDVGALLHHLPQVTRQLHRPLTLVVFPFLPTASVQPLAHRRLNVQGRATCNGSFQLLYSSCIYELHELEPPVVFII